jgi:hypothetical protein
MKPFSCETDLRRAAVRAAEGWIGLDFLEVDNAQTTLTVNFLGAAPDYVGKENIVIVGGRTPRDAVQVVSLELSQPDGYSTGGRLLVMVDKPGDYSTYILRLTGLDRIDPRYQQIDFSFKANCPSDLDCQGCDPCPPEVLAQPAIDYLAKDYASFRQLVFDRLALICPDWKERHVPDLGVALVEILAYTGDYLSYYQDAVATEAYLYTARRRPSVRRHARLVDYYLSEGCNARAAVAIEVSGDVAFAASDVQFITGVNHLLPVGERAALVRHEIEGLAPDSYEVFEPIHDGEIRLWLANNTLYFHTWGGRGCCLARGATQATLRGELSYADDAAVRGGVHLRPGDLLIFEEVLGPVTGKPVDADPRHRHAVRLTSVAATRDELLDQPIIEISWAEQDALPFSLCISAIGAAPDCRFLDDITIARANVVAVDHGRATGPEDIGTVPVVDSPACCECEGQPSEVTKSGGRFRPRLRESPLTFTAPWPLTAPAAALFSPDPWSASPSITVNAGGTAWEPRTDLVSSGPGDRHFVAEMEENGEAVLLFGNGDLGKAPPPASTFHADYRIGNGRAGNVGSGAIRLLIHRESNLTNDITKVWNLLPAQGGADREPTAEAKLNAPFAFRVGPQALRRAITADDYARIAERHPKIQRAAARLVWTGSWFEAEVGVDAIARHAPHLTDIAAEVEAYLEAFRRIGHDLDVRNAEFIPIDLALRVCIAPEYIRGHVKAALLDAFSNRLLPDGATGFFHPDRLTFGDDLYLSRVIAAAQTLPGVVSVQVQRMQRQFESPNREIQNGLLPLGPFEIAQLDNDPNYPDHGRLEIQVLGGRG